MKIKLPVLLFHWQQYKKYAALFNAIVNSALVLVVVNLNIYDFKVTNTTIA
jgi:hypothetical protein